MKATDSFADFFNAIQVDVKDLMKPKKVTIADIDGVEREFTLHRFDAITGKAIADNYIQASVPKISHPAEKAAILNCIFRHVTVEVNGEKVQLDSSPAFTSAHVGDWEVLQKLENEMLAYNTSFLPNGALSILEGAQKQIIEHLALLISTLSSPS